MIDLLQTMAIAGLAAGNYWLLKTCKNLVRTNAALLKMYSAPSGPPIYPLPPPLDP